MHGKDSDFFPNNQTKKCVEQSAHFFCDSSRTFRFRRKIASFRIKLTFRFADYKLVDSPLPANIFKDHCSAWVQYSCYYTNYSEKLRGNLFVYKQAYDMCISFSNLRDLIPDGYFQQWKLWNHGTRQIDNFYIFYHRQNIQDSITMPIFNMNDSCIGELVFERVKKGVKGTGT